MPQRKNRKQTVDANEDEYHAQGQSRVLSANNVVIQRKKKKKKEETLAPRPTSPTRTGPLSKKKVPTDFWTVIEPCELYRCVNKYVRTKGLLGFGPYKESGMKDSVFTTWANRIDAVGGKNRNKDSVWSQVLKKRVALSKEIFEVLQRAKWQRDERRRAWLRLTGRTRNSHRM
jgi:hypothetical protein